MRPHPIVFAFGLVTVLGACEAAQDENANTTPSPERTNVDAAEAMASFARMVPGEWRQTAQRGTSTFDTWHWGPGRRSMRVMTDGSGSQVVPEPWRELQVFYWHPGRAEVRLLGLSPFARGVSEGTIRFDGETAEGVFDAWQTQGRRKLGLRWTFDGPDRYRDVLLEERGSDGLQPMNAWVHVRSAEPPAPRDPVDAEPPEHSGFLKPLEPLLGHTWEAAIAPSGGVARTTFEWIPYADGIYARTVVLTGGGEPEHALDAYFFHHTGLGRLRCLALWESGAVFEGDVTVLDGGALQLDLTAYEADRATPRVVRIDFEADGTLRQRDWSIAGAERTLVLDVRHVRLATKKD